MPDIQTINGREMSTVPMLPRKDVLDGSGTIWEDILYRRGWNELETSKKICYSTGSFRLSSGAEVTDIYFPFLDLELKNIFWNELKLYPEKE